MMACCMPVDRQHIANYTPNGSNPARGYVIWMAHRQRAEIFALPSLIQAPVQLKRSADKRHMSKGLGKITELFCRGT